MNSAPAVLRMPVCSPAEMEAAPYESYPWVAHTPEASPRCWSMAPNPACLTAPLIPDHLMRSVCAPYFDQMCCSITTQQMSANSTVSQEQLRTMCEPFFQQMVGALQQTLHHHPSHIQPMQYYRVDDASTEADDSCAFSSLFSGASSPSSESDVLEVSEIKSEDSEGDADKSIMVCRHWKSKGFCRLESKCKFLHPQHKCGIDVTVAGVPGMDMAAAAGKRKKRGGKNRSNRGQGQLGNELEIA